MDVTNQPLPESPADSAPVSLGELAVQNGRLHGARRPRLPPQAATSQTPALEREKEALRIQAAAVAAEQAALTEQEIRLQQRSVALEQQEKQLAAHLEDKRQRLLALRDEIRQARANLVNERALYEKRVAQVLVNLEQSRREVNANFHQAKAERHRLRQLQRRLKQRWHRHWAAEREAMRQREAELDGQRSRLEKERLRLEHEKASLAQSQMRLKDETQLARRDLQAEWDKLHQEKAALGEHWQSLEQRETQLLEAQQRLAADQEQGEAARANLKQEIEGLENRVQNLRRKLLDQTKEVARLEASGRSLQSLRTSNVSAPLSPVEQVSASAAVVAESRIADLEEREWQVQQLELELQSRTAALETLADELADQRLQLAEAIAAELEILSRRLEDRRSVPQAA